MDSATTMLVWHPADIRKGNTSGLIEYHGTLQASFRHNIFQAAASWFIKICSTFFLFFFALVVYKFWYYAKAE